MWAEFGLSQMFQCVKEVPANMHQGLTKKKKKKFMQWCFFEENWWSHSKGISIRWKLPVLFIHFFWKLENQKRNLLAECFLPNITKHFLQYWYVTSFNTLLYPLIKYVLCDRHCDIVVTTVSIFIPFITPLGQRGAPRRSTAKRTLWGKCSHFSAEENGA